MKKPAQFYVQQLNRIKTVRMPYLSLHHYEQCVGLGTLNLITRHLNEAFVYSASSIQLIYISSSLPLCLHLLHVCLYVSPFIKSYCYSSLKSDCTIFLYFFSVCDFNTSPDCF